ncbi:MAG TPA: SCP2 sterol-binding domain-containing protein [Acidimicrobiales bacterium]|nr:SCP2 sterol-binding domain-containing protein [Acidimicrobiales bacterium]
MDRAAAGSEALRRATAGVRVRIQQVVRDGTDERCYVVSVDDGLVRVRAGREPDAEVVVTEDAATAAAVARGELSAQTAFMTGRIRVAGDIPALLACYEALGGADDAFAGVRAVTTW